MLQGERIGPLAVVSVEELCFYEGFAQQGRTLLSLIRGWKSGPDARQRFRNYLIALGAAASKTVGHVTRPPRDPTLLATRLPIATFALAGGDPTPGAGLIAKSAGWVALANGVVCVLAVGFASLIGSRAAALTALIGWELVVSPQLVDAASLGAARKVLIDAAVLRVEPGPAISGTPHVPMSIATVAAVLVAWPLAVAIMGAWRTRVRDA